MKTRNTNKLNKKLTETKYNNLTKRKKKSLNSLKLLNSFSPIINKNLDIKELKTLRNQNINLCNNLLEINIGSSLKPKCLNFNNILVKKFLLKNLMASKHLDPSKFIAPKQLYSNCWFNTMFVVFFLVIKVENFLDFLEI